MCVVAGALRRSDGRWLMHRRPPFKHHGNLWEFPGGKVEPGETPGDALIRELREELGITVARSAIRPASFADGGLGVAHGGIVILLYTVTEWTGTPQALEDGAHIDWFLSHEIDRLPRPPLDIALCSAMFPESGRIGP